MARNPDTCNLLTNMILGIAFRSDRDLLSGYRVPDALQKCVIHRSRYLEALISRLLSFKLSRLLLSC